MLQEKQLNRNIKSRQVKVLCFYLVLLIIFLSSDLKIGVFLFILTVGCTINFVSNYIKSGRIFLFSGLNLFLAWYLLTHVIGYYAYDLRKELNLNNYLFTNDRIVESLFIASIGLFSFLILYYTSNKYIHLKYPNFYWIRFKSVFKHKNTKWILLIVLIYCFSLYFWNSMGGIPLFIDNYHQSERASMGKGLGYIEALITSLTSFSSLYYIYAFKKKKYGKFFVVLTLSIILLNLLNASRGPLVFFIFGIWMIYSLLNHQPKLKNIILISFGMILIAGFLGALRTKNANALILSTTIAFTETAVEFDNYVEVINMVDENGYLNGSTLVPIFTLPIPRSILPDKDSFLTAGNYFKQYHNHDHIRVGERISYIGELYLNFGIVGVILGMSLVGCVLAQIDKLASCKSLINLFIYFQLVFTFMSLVNGDIPTVIISFFMGNFLLILGILFFYCVHITNIYGTKNNC